MTQWVPPKPVIFKFDPKKPKPDAFAAYTVMQIHEAHAEGMRNATPIDMVLHCPKCHVQHIDAPEESDPATWTAERYGNWTNPPHRSHLCHACGYIWRPADVPTNGVRAITTRGRNDSK